MKRNVFTVILTFNLLGLLSSCFPDCPAEKYYDYRSISFHVTNPNVQTNEKLSFGIRHEDIIYVTEKKKNFQFSTSAYATSICEKGYDGEKYPVIKISVKSNADFSGNLPAGSELSGIVKALGLNVDKEEIESTIDNLNPTYVNIYYMHIELKPEVHKKHRFTIEIEKSNHEILKATTEEITFQ
ncbi:hypothetical protein [Flavobacterium panacagri]|uniref:hypothetical protein n=1 Tax=Flavobacterium panacagri TaxID=3034146 RepID=UPI0025A63028|nr:hypothetical protein [Flavobacterium panacagri]